MHSQQLPGLDIYDIHFDKLLNGIKDKLSSSKFTLSETVLSKIKAIQEICNTEFMDQKFYGASALNRKMLLHPIISELLTPDVICGIFWLHSQKPNEKNLLQIYRNSGSTTIADAMYYAFKEGLEIIKLMPTNDLHYSTEMYNQQKIYFEKGTLQIAKNILNVAIELNVDIAAAKKINSQVEGKLISRFVKIRDTIECIKKSGTADELLAVPGYQPDAIRRQAVRGFLKVCGLLLSPAQYTYLAEENRIILHFPKTVDGFVNHLISSEATLLNGEVSHLFYDRVHLEACVESNFKIVIGEKTYLLKDILEQAILSCTNDGNANFALAHEQFALRLKLIDADLNNRFPFYHQPYHISPTMAQACYQIINARGSGNEISTLKNDGEIEDSKMFKTLELMDIKVARLKFRAHNGYWLSANKKEIAKLSDLCEQQIHLVADLNEFIRIRENAVLSFIHKKNRQAEIGAAQKLVCIAQGLQGISFDANEIAALNHKELAIIIKRYSMVTEALEQKYFKEPAANKTNHLNC